MQPGLAVPKFGHYGGVRVGGARIGHYYGGTRIGARYYGRGYVGPRYGGYRGYRYGYVDLWPAWGLSALAASWPYYYYGGDYFDAPFDDSAVAYCMRRFKSYDPISGTYLGYDGYRHPCP